MRRNAETAPSPEENSAIAVLWKQFGLLGKPPKPGSVAEQRLFDACEAYVKKVIHPEHTKVPGSESDQRRLHNEIAVMVLGKERSGMAYDEASKITEFACQLITGMSTGEAIAEYENGGRES